MSLTMSCATNSLNKCKVQAREIHFILHWLGQRLLLACYRTSEVPKGLESDAKMQVQLIIV